MECTAHGGQQTDVIRLVLQVVDRLQGVGNDFARFLQEDFAHFIVFFQPGGFGHGDRCRSQGRLGREGRNFGLIQANGIGHRLSEISHDLRHLLAGSSHGFVIVGHFRRFDGRLCGGQRVSQLGLLFDSVVVDQLLQALRHLVEAHVFALQGLDHVFCNSLSFFQLNLLNVLSHGLDRVIQFGWRQLLAAHDGRQHARFGIEFKQRLGQGGLHAHHVDQETQGAQIGRQTIEHAGLCRLVNRSIGHQQVFDVFAHASHSLRGEVQAQHRQHALHGLQLRRHVGQRGVIGRIPEILIDLLFGFRQGGAQFLHHAANGLAIRDPTVQVLHPTFQWLGSLPLADRSNALGQTAHALLLIGVIELAIFQGSFEVQQAGGHFHGQARFWPLSRLNRLSNGLRQGISQQLAIRIEATQRIGHERELFVQTTQAQQLAGGHSRPAVFRTGNALDGLGHPSGVIATQVGRFQVHRLVPLQTKGLANTGEHGVDLAGLLHRLSTEEQQFVRETV